MRARTLALLECPNCAGSLSCSETRDEITSGSVSCDECDAHYPVLAGVLVLIHDVRDYLIEHVKGIARYVRDEDVPKAFRADLNRAKKQISSEHIEEDLEAERVTALYVMNHYLSAAEVGSTDPILNELIKHHWESGPLASIKRLVETRGFARKPSLIELGSGVGGLCKALEGQLDSYLGLDSSFASVALARHLALGLPLKGHRQLVPQDLLHGALTREVRVKAVPPACEADFVVCDLSAPPVKTEAWDISVALNVIDMLSEPRDLPRLQHSLLSPGGVAFQSCPYVWHPDVALHLRKTLPRAKVAAGSAAAVEHLYQEAGFSIEVSQSHVPWLFFKHDRQLELYSAHLFMAIKSR